MIALETEEFSRNVCRGIARRLLGSAALALSDPLSSADRVDIGIEPAISRACAREMAVKQIAYSLPRKLHLPSGTPLWRRMA